jgi:hypothetical protein
MCFNFGLSFRILLLSALLEMRISINLDCQLQLRAIKIHNIIPDTILPLEFVSKELPVSKFPPKEFFGFGLFPPQGCAEFLLGVSC